MLRTNHDTSSRFEYLDIVKGIGIILVVLHHTLGRDNPIHIYIVSFHMPLFFMISGLCFNEERYSSFMIYLRRKSKVLLLPLIYFTIAMCIGSVYFVPEFYSINKLLQGRLPAAYWFVWVLFLAELSYFCLCRLSKQILLRWIFLILALIISLLLKRYNIAWPFCTSSLFIAIFLYGLGYQMCGKQICKLLEYRVIGGGYFTPANFDIYHSSWR